MPLFEAIMFVFGSMLSFCTAMTDFLASIHWALPWVAGIVLAVPFGRAGYRLSAR